MSDAQEAGRILVVDDDINVRTILKMQLERNGYSVEVAEDGETALGMIANGIPDIILLDVMMPGMDGWEVCRSLRADFATANIPVVMLTARSDQVDKVRGLTGGANDYLTKPYELEELLLRLRNILQWSHLQRAANPLTGLPGNVAIENEVRQRLKAGSDFTFFYIDIDNFKGFNDYYSFRKGDEAIRLTASIILGAVTIEGSGGDFVGHVGGDDFVVVVDCAYGEAVIDEIIEEFDRKVPKLYDAKDREAGYIETTDRQGQPVRHRIMTLTVAAVSSKDQVFEHMGEISQAVAELKSYGKKSSKSVVVWERRAA